MRDLQAGRLGSGYAIWVGPSDNSLAYAGLRRCIDAISEKYGTPRFAPHLTLLSGIRGEEDVVVENTKCLAASLCPFRIKFGETGSDGTYFQAIYLRAKQTAALMAANRLAQHLCERHKPTFVPHASLAYGDFSPQAIRYINCDLAAEIASVTNTAFRVKHLDLWSTIGPIEHWSFLRRFPLTKDNAP